MKRAKVLRSGKGKYSGYTINMYGYPSTRASSIGDVVIFVVALVALLAVIYYYN